ncbi:hypothetical protein Scep_023958 [Stephania cephalantha]|uniref:Uncharacterized protein n=1 Tax=Stephania cephalantha TaxID=152367 RepID=A0AAP0HT93_9MAGN
MSNPHIPQHEGNQQFHQNTSLEDMVKQLIDNQQKVNQILDEIRQIDFWIPSLKDLETKLDQYNARLQDMTDEEELCSTQPIFNPEEDPEIIIALNEGENEMKIDVISDKPEKPQIESEEDQPLIFYTADTDDPDATDSFVLEVPNELQNLKEGVHA